MTTDELLDVIAAERRRIAEANGRMTRALARFAALRDAEGQHAGKYAAEEVAVTLTVSPVSASARLAEAEHLTGALPGTLAALERGEIDSHQAHAIAEATSLLDPELVQAVEARILPNAHRWTPSRIRERIRYHLARLDPEGARERARERATTRRVQLDDHGDGLATLSAQLPLEQAYAAFRRLCDLASRGDAGDARSTDQRRADALVDLLLGSDREYLRTEIQVIVPASVLAGGSDGPGELVGVGYLDADTVRELAASDATWRRVLTDPADGTVREVSRRRFPPADLARHVRLRDRRCRFPGCARPAAACDLDHTVRYADGGATAEGNLGALCPRHNQLKETGRWTVTQPVPGRFEWIDPTGTTHVTTPDDDPAPC